MLDSDEVRGSADLRVKLAIALSRLRDGQALAALIRLARDDRATKVRLQAMWGLSTLGDRAAVPLFLEQVKSSDPKMRLHAVHGLANSRVDEAVEPLIDLLGDPSPSVSSAAARGLADLGDEAALKPMRAAVRRAWWRPFHRLVLRLHLARLEERLGR
jgi:HEAT repeat protein